MPAARSAFVHVATVLSVGALLFACSSSSSPSGPAADGGSSGTPAPPPGQPPAPPGASDAGDDGSTTNCPTKYEPLSAALARWNIGDGTHVSWEYNDASCTSAPGLVMVVSAAFPLPKRSDDGNPCAPPHAFVQYNTQKMTDCGTIDSASCTSRPAQGGYAFWVEALTDPPPSDTTYLGGGSQYLCTPDTNTCALTDSTVGDILLLGNGTVSLGANNISYKKPTVPIEAMLCN